MRILLSPLPDPTDIVIQGMTIGDVKIEDEYIPIPSMFAPVLQGQVIGDYTPQTIVPAAMIGQHEWYGIKPSQIGPMIIAGGDIVMIDIGSSKPDLFVDKIQRWLSSVYQVDKAGFILSLYDAEVLGAPEPIASFTLAGPGPIIEPVVTIPRGAIYRSGLAKRITAPVLPASFGGHPITVNFYQTTQKWFITVTVRDETGAIVVGATVYLMFAEDVQIDPDVYGNPIKEQAITDSSGQCVFQISKDVLHQFMGSKSGTPNKNGLSINTIVKDSSVTLYIKDPSSPGGGSGATSWAY